VRCKLNISAGRLFLLAAVVAFPSLAEQDDSVVPEMEQRDQITAHARQLLRDRKFAELEAEAENSRVNKVRLPSGFWTLNNFYEGLESPAYGASGAGWDAHLRLLEEWQAAFPKSPTPQTALAGAYAKYAWQARGTGYAREVTEEGWRLFRERLTKAAAVIQKAQAESHYDPHLADVELIVAKGLSWPADKYERIFNEAVKREPCYPYYYLQRAGYLLPRWNGEPGDVERFAAQAIQLSEACEGKGIYARIAVYLLPYKDKEQWFFDAYKLSWPKVRQGFDDLEKRYPNSAWNLNEYCLLACHAQDAKTAAGLFKRIGEHWDSTVWRTEGDFRRWQEWSEHPTPIHTTEHPDAGTRWKQWLRDLLSW
jgi:hypothetical protein